VERGRERGRVEEERVGRRTAYSGTWLLAWTKVGDGLEMGREGNLPSA